METEHYIDGEHNGGVFNSFNLNTYSYCYQNPVVLVDPDGKQTRSGTLGGIIAEQIGGTVGGIIGYVLDLPTSVVGAILRPVPLNGGEQVWIEQKSKRDLENQKILLTKKDSKSDEGLDKLKEGSNGQKLAKKLQKYSEDGNLPTPDNNPDQFERSNSNGDKVHKKTGAIYRRSNTTHRGKEGEFKIWPKGTKNFGNTSKTTGNRITTDNNGGIIGH